MTKEYIEDVVICFDNRNINNEIDKQISLLNMSNIPNKRKGNKLIIDYNFVIVHIYFMTIRNKIDGFRFKHIRISEMASTELKPEKLCQALKVIQSGRLTFENYPK
ncbi:hypothetical protein [Leuconostoc holzapfelii]|uniref:Uncharacterized protein n=1 Tax=Leuconostoc holzapfelii TaxID=434464 RepID=A0A846ZCH3_9LACO|nr:hypothetical protein [Leuconostoc holzapfelii]NKZ18568.1 hypothetical protein [Leuconostoc holzapfelii]